MDFDVLPREIRGKNVLITIDAPFLTDNEALKAACQDALAKTAEAMQSDVTMLRKDEFVHDKTNWSVKSYKGEDYYSSGLIPYWRGGLYRSFTVGEGADWSEKTLAFTASYAPLIENGGAPSEIPLEWAVDKEVGGKAKEGTTYSIHPHPFTATVAQKLASGLEDFGYLDICGLYFAAYFNRYL